MRNRLRCENMSAARVHLHVPALDELAEVLEEGLRTNFSEVKVRVVECPDLSLSTWNLAAPGLCGSPRLLDVGGVPYLMPVPDKSKSYDLGSLAKISGVPGGLMIGAGAGSSKVAGVNCEMMVNARAPVNSDPGHNNTQIAKVSTEDGSCVLEHYPSFETGPLANVFLCEGKPGKVLEVRAKKRTGLDNFVSVMRKSVGERYGEQSVVACGGVFQITSGRAKLHIMPDFSNDPLTSDEAVNRWLRFYDMSSPLTCLSEFVSHDPGLDLRVEHTHCFSHHGEGGHYHYDITPNDVEYHGYYNVAEQLIRIDQPLNTHNFGRD